MAQTYREAIQLHIDALQQIYDNANGLRDAATEEEKKTWNFLREKLPDIWSALQFLDNSLPQGRADYQLKGAYKVQSPKN